MTQKKINLNDLIEYHLAGNYRDIDKTEFKRSNVKMLMKEAIRQALEIAAEQATAQYLTSEGVFPASVAKFSITNVINLVE